MIDIHHHLLTGVDDGARDLSTSIEMAKMAVADGITHVVCTPHASSQYTYDPSLVSERISELAEQLAQAGVTLQLGMGCDFHLNFENVRDAFEHRDRYTINGKQYLLVELPDYGITPAIGEHFYELQLAGFIPILTHPERNLSLQRNMEPLREWLRSGVLVQVTAGSVTGLMGKTAQQTALKMLKNNWVHFLATDAHNLRSRSPKLTEARMEVARRFGSHYAELLTVINPRCAYEGEPMPAQQPMLELFDDSYNKQPFWRRLFGSV